MNGSLLDHPRHQIKNGHPPAATPEDWGDLLRAMADPIRMRMVRLLEHTAHHGLSVGELADVLKLPQSTVSRHLKALCDATLASARRDGTSMVYRLSDLANQTTIRQLRTLAKQYLDSDATAKADGQRLLHVLRQRETAAEKFFGQTAPKWDQIRQQWFGDTFHLEAMLTLLNPQWTVGDLGTGTGAMLPLVAPHVKQVIAVEPTTAMLKTARQRIKDQALANVDLRQGSLEALPIADRTLDVALVALVLHHVIDPAAAFKEIRRVLTPGGIFLLIDLQPHNVEMFRDQMGHRWMGFHQDQLTTWLTTAGFINPHWHALPSRTARSKADGVTVPDLFAMRAQTPN